jgi:phosphoribosyl 1,2-cyclic phosphodiesterase
MALRFTVLASGSAGNATLVEVDGFGLLLDAGLGPRQLAGRFLAAGTSWDAVQAVILSHTHSDHWNDRTFATLHRRRLPLYCHPGHRPVLRQFAPAFTALETARLVRDFEPGREILLGPRFRCKPLPVPHDAGPTFGFRLEGPPDLFGEPVAAAYAADLGCWDGALARSLSNVDLLALEFNHDVDMEQGSGRQPRVIARVLGDEGHLSNVQAAALVSEVLRLSPPGRLQHLVQLHLSRDCNRPVLAQAAAREALTGLPVAVEVFTASQDTPSPTIHVGNGQARKRRSSPRRAPTPRPLGEEGPIQRWLPGLEGA